MAAQQKLPTFLREGGTLNCDHWESASALLCPQGWLSSWSPTALCVPQGMLSLSPAEMFLLCPAGMLSLSLQGCSVLGQQDLGAVAVGPSHTLPQLQQFLQAAPCKGSDRHGKVSRRIEHLTVICLTKCYRLQCLTPGYGRNPGRRKRWEGKQRGVLKTSKTRWDWDVFLVLAGDVLPRLWGQPCSTAGQAHLNKDIIVSVAVTVPGCD